MVHRLPLLIAALALALAAGGCLGGSTAATGAPAAGATEAPVATAVPTPAESPGAASPTPEAPTTGIEGLVTMGPICPVGREASPCPDRPYTATLIVSDGAGREVARVISDVDGTYRIPLSPGAYTVEPQSPPDRILPRAEPFEVVVPAAGYVRADIKYDSGIR